MGEKKVSIELDEYEQNIVFKALNDMRTNLIATERPTDAVDDLMIKTYEAKKKRFRVAEGQDVNERYR
ncbi:MAG: hypothetical protein GX663_06970 [Clostridiales bacterium]|nr:hypothetical protein [Clostridiales bacterium]